MKFLISGGGTGGHIFPAVSIANAIRKAQPDAEILFVGALGRMEMEKVPAEGYRIIGLPVRGFIRPLFHPGNLMVLLDLIKSIRQARRIIREFQPDVAVGVGGYASAAALKAAASLGIPYVLQEQNGFAGVTNQKLARGARRICVAYPGMERFFPADRLVMTGNPVRQALLECQATQAEARQAFGLDPQRPTIFVTGGSLGARSVNQAICAGLAQLQQAGVQVLWQTGKADGDRWEKAVSDLSATLGQQPTLIHPTVFVSDMAMAYRAADVVVSRSGAGAVNEVCLLGKAAIFIPLPTAAEDHQTANARSLSDRQAAILIPDGEAAARLVNEAIGLVNDPQRIRQLEQNALAAAHYGAADTIAHIVINEALQHRGQPVAAPQPEAPVAPQPRQAIYFVGAGGIGMSALARYFLANGYRVGGYDKTPSPLTEALMREGVDLHFTDSVEAIHPDFLDPSTCTVCYTPAIPAQHTELCYFREHGFRVLKRSQILGDITRERRGLCVAGTHGKTTTSSMIAHILKQSHVDCNAFLGGILKPYESNLMLAGDAHSHAPAGAPASDLTVIEADEFDRSFHTLQPFMSVITSCDPDHLDIYGTEQAYRESFAHYVSLIRPDGLLLRHQGIQVDCSRLAAGARLAQYGVVADDAVADATTLPDFYATRLRTGQGTILFDFVIRRPSLLDPSLPDEPIVMRDFEPGVPTAINVDNATAALAICWLNGCTEDEMRSGLRSFGGARRRFDFHLRRPDLVVVDDYAHHPDEIRASLTSIRQLFEGRHVTVCFQPHLYSRTHDLVDGFAQALAIPDRCLLLPIYPAREQPIPGVTSEWLLERIDSADKALVTVPELLPRLQQLRSQGKLDVVVMMGAGVDIERQVAPVAQALSQS